MGPALDTNNLELTDGARVAVMGGGPAGSFFSYFLLEMAGRIGLELQVDIYEPRDFSIPGPPGCNMCGGIVSESLVQMLAAEGIILPPTVVQRGISAYVMHSDAGSVRIDTPMEEKRIGAIYRGAGPKGLEEAKWGSFDGHLLSLAQEKGARVIHSRVSQVSGQSNGVAVGTRSSSPQVYELLAVTTGINTAALKLFDGMDLAYKPPHTTKTFIREYYLGAQNVSKYLGNAMHVFLLNIPRLEFAAIIPKGDYASLILLGDEINDELIDSLVESPEIRQLMPADLPLNEGACQCRPRISVRGAVQPFGDRIVFVGDCGATRLYKDGIGAAYRTAKSAAAAAVFQGISAEDFRRHYLPACQAIEGDNALGKVIFWVTRQIQKSRFSRRAVLRMAAAEQQRERSSRWMSIVLWDMFTGSAPYREIFLRTVHPAFWSRFLWDNLASIVELVAGFLRLRSADHGWELPQTIDDKR
jgi:flavin-dependent dehydrogenase